MAKKQKSPLRKLVEAEFFETDRGNKPVRDFLLGLDAPDRKQIGSDLQVIELNWPVGMPLCRAVGSLWECRSSIREGKVEARVMFGLDGRRMILLRGYEKRPSNQDREIKNAEAAWKTYLARKAKERKHGKAKKR